MKKIASINNDQSEIENKMDNLPTTVDFASVFLFRFNGKNAADNVFL